MPRLIKVNKWSCNICGEQYDEKADAVDCQERCRKNRHAAELRKIFPTRYKTDTRFIKHCVKCGKKVLEYKYEFDGPETSRGPIIFSDESRLILLDGYYCGECHQKVIRSLCKYLKGRRL